MITIFDKNQVAYIIRPCPLINISWSSNFNEDGQIGGKYDITLTGTILDNNGSPIYTYNTGNTIVQWTPNYYPNGPGTKPAQTDYPVGVGQLGALKSILAKQVALRELFSRTCARVEVASVNPGDTEPVITFYPKFISIDFAEGIWVDKCDYTVTLEAEFLLDKDEKVIGSESYASKTFKPGEPGWPETGGAQPTRLDINVLLEKIGGFVEDFQESWSIEPEDGQGNTTAPNTNTEHITRVYRLTRNISAKGKNITGYQCFGDKPPEFYKAHEQARRYVVNHINNSGNVANHWDDYPSSSSTPVHMYLASGILNLHTLSHAGYNHSRTENLDITQGTYSVADTWILSSGNSTENYSLSLSTSEADPTHKVSIDGTIRGLTSIPGSGSVFGGSGPPTTSNTAYENAINKYRQITNSGQFGMLAHTFKRAQNAAGGITLNHIPLSVSLATNEFTGEINYTIEYDDRPLNTVAGTSFESISVTDTYPGDVFAVIPVIGRATGPVLQYIGGRTEYQRSLSLELVVDKSLNPPNANERLNLLQKPSLRNPTRSGIINAVNAYSPARETGIRKYFVSPPQETWDPKSGRYTLNINWTYELDR
jgi:hypothetical protein